MPTNALSASPLAVSPASLSAPTFNPPVVLGDYALDYGLRAFPTKCNRIYACSGPLTDYDSVIASAVGYKDFGGGFAFGGITNGSPSGRVVTSLPFNDGTITQGGTATTWAAVDVPDQQLLAWGILANNVPVIAGQLFSLPTFVIHEYSWFAGANINVTFSANNLASKAAFLGRPVEKLSLVDATSLATGAAAFATPTLVPGNVLVAFSFQPIRADAIGTPAMVQKHKLTATGIASKAASLGSSGIVFLGQYNDGFTGAPAGTPQYPTLLNAYGTNRPPWNVAGVDYHVGVASGITMKDASVQANLPAGATATASTRQVIISGANVTLGSATQGFTLPTDWQIYINTSASGTITLQNISIVTTTHMQGISCDGDVNLTVYNCEVNGSKYSSANPQDAYVAGGIQYNGTKSLVCRYCYLHDLPCDGFQANAGNFDIQYSVVYGLGYTLGDASGGHPDTFQAVGGFGAITSGRIAFITSVYPVMPNGNGNEILDFEAQLGADCSDIIYANNTLIAIGPTSGESGIMSGSFVDDTTSTLKGFQYVHNYLDPSGTIYGCFGTPVQCAGTVGYPLVYQGNYCMAAFNNGQGDVNPLGPYNPAQVGRVPIGSVTATAGASDTDVWTVAASPATGTLNVGDSVTFTITYVRLVNASAASLTLNNGATAAYVSGTGTKILTFKYTVASGDATITNLKINAVNGTVTDQFGNVMVETNALKTFTGLNVGSGTSSNVPVITPVSFTLADPITNDELVGTINATNTPTAWAISGTGSNYFAIYLQTGGSAHLRTLVSGTVPPDNTYNLSVTASNASGTSAPVTVPVQIGSGAPAAPVVTATSFTLSTPVTNGETVGTVTASNAPTSFAITAGNSSGYFVISNSGVLTIEPSGAVPPSGSYSLSVTATNATGTSPAATIGVTIQAALPVVSGASFTLIDPVTNGETVGTVTATNSPTSFTITAGNSSGYFTITTAGVLKTAASGAVPPDGNYSLSITATNANGTGAPGTVTVAVQASTGGGTYDNLNHWPSANNRPVYNPANNSLTWIGPTAGGPSTHSDPQQTLVLSAQEAGGISTSAAGQIIQGRFFSGGNPIISVDHNNVTIRRCYLKGTGGNDKYNIDISPGVTGTVIEDCEINGNGVASESGSFNIIATGAVLQSITIRRCNLHHAEQQVARTMQNVTIIDNYMHDVTGVDADMVEIYCDSGPSHDVLIQHNTFWEPAGQAATNSFNSAINMSNWTNAGGIVRVNITGNRFICPDNPHVFCDDNRQGSGPVSYSATNNGFINTITFVQTGDNNGVSPNSGNFILTSTDDSVITGAPFNGTGAI